jgi:hypothetical protein
MNKALPPKVQLAVGAVLVAVGIFPWAYTPLFFGTRPIANNEGAGMLGTLIFLFLGLPGLSLVVSALVALLSGRGKGGGGGASGRT